MRQRLRPKKAYLFADRLRICVGLNCAETDENRLLKMLLQEVSLSLGHLAKQSHAQPDRARRHLRASDGNGDYGRGFVCANSASSETALGQYSR